jgi:hypothetical protein
MQMSSKKKVVAVAITTLALTVGGVGIGNADTVAKKITKRTVTTKKVTTSGTAGIANPMEKGKGHEAQIASVLSGLVTKGTITQAQADAVIAALEADRAAKDADRPLAKDRAAIDALVASTLGIDSPTIKSRLKAGETLAAIAGSKKAALIDALVAEESKRIDAAVTAGKLTADQATARKSGLVAHVTAEVESVRPMGDKGPKGSKGGRGHHGGPMGAAPSVPLTGAAA